MKKVNSEQKGEIGTFKFQEGKKFRIQFDFEYKGTSDEVNSLPSETIPDMALTVRQLLENHVRGIDNKIVARNPLYFESEIPVLNDLTDLETYKESLKRRLDEVKTAIEAEKQEADSNQVDLEDAIKEAEAEESPKPKKSAEKSE